MEEEVEKIPEFFNYAGSEYNYIILDIPSFYDVLTWERDTQVFFTSGMEISLKNLMELMK